MSDAIDTYVNKRQRQAASNSSYAQELGQVYLNNGVEIDLDYVINENANPSQTPELSESEMITDPNWIYASKELYNAFKPSEEVQAMISNDYKPPSTDEEFAAWGVEFVGMLEHNLGNLAIRSASIPEMTDAQKISMGYMLQEFGKLPMFSWNGTKRFFKGVISDPVTWASLGMYPLLVQLGKAGAKRVTKEGLQTAIRTALSPNAIAAYEGGGYTGAFDYLKQSAIVAGEQAAGNTEAAVDPIQTGLATAAGAALGPVLQEGIPIAAEAAVRGGQRVASATGDAIQKLAQGAKARQEERGTGTTLRSGIDPTEVVDDALAMLAKDESSPLVDELGFYSRLSKAASELKQEKATGRQYLGMLKNSGVSDTEIKATGMDRYLDTDQVMTKEEVLGMLEIQRKQIKETRLGQPLTDDQGDIVEVPGMQFEEFDLAKPVNDVDFDYVRQEEIDSIRQQFEDSWLDESVFSDDVLRIMQKKYPERYDESNPAWKERILSAYKNKNEESLGATTQKHVEEALEQKAEDAYSQNPFKGTLVTGPGDEQIRIIGNNDMGYSLISNTSGWMQNVSDFNEAKIVATQKLSGNDFEPNMASGGDTTVYGDYRLDGGTNYQELVFSSPGSEASFDRSHWRGIPDYVAHARTTDRVDDQGRKILFVEEIQSDLNKGIRDGNKFIKSIRENFDENQNLIPEAEIANRLSDDLLNSIKTTELFGQDARISATAYTLLGRIEDELGIPISGNSASALLTAIKRNEPVWVVKFDSNPNSSGEVLFKASSDFPSFKRDVEVAKKDAEIVEKQIEQYKKEPFANTDRYTQMVLRRLINKAVSEGYAGIGFTPGKFQASQYGQPEGQIAFYDRILPKQIKQVLKDVDKNMRLGQTKITELESYYDKQTAAELGMADYNVPYLDISQAGKTKVQKEGLPIMESATGIGAATALGAAATQGQGESANAN